MKPDEYVYTFSCQLPDDLPTSLVGSFGSIRYSAVVTINVPLWPDKTFEEDFTVIKTVNLNEMFELKVSSNRFTGEREKGRGEGGVYSMQSDVILIFEFALTGLNQRGKEEGILFVLSVVLFQNTATVHCGQTDSHRIHTWPAHGIETRSGESELESD